MKTAAAIKFSSQPVTRSMAHTKTNGTDTPMRPFHLYKSTYHLSSYPSARIWGNAHNVGGTTWGLSSTSLHCAKYSSSCHIRHDRSITSQVCSGFVTPLINEYVCFHCHLTLFVHNKLIYKDFKCVRWFQSILHSLAYILPITPRCRAVGLGVCGGLYATGK